MKYTLIAVLAILSLIPANTRAQVPAPILPEFSFTRTDNTSFTNKDLPQNRQLFFMLFDPTCPHCQMAIMRIDKDRKSFQPAAVYLISMEDWGKIDSFLASFAPHLRSLDNVTILQDKPGLLIARFRPRQFPAMFLYSADKKLIDYEDNPATVFRFVNAIGKK
jgi:hypothetical protein